MVPYKARSFKEVSMRPLILIYTVPINAFVFVLEGVDSDEVSEPSQALLGAIAGASSAKLTGPASVRWEDII